MNANIFKKVSLLIIIIALLTIVLTGCGPTIPICTTATVNITTPNDNWTYYIYIDGVYWGATNSSGSMTLYNVPVGYHTFYAISNDYAWDGTAYATIVCGINNVPIYTGWI